MVILYLLIVEILIQFVQREQIFKKLYRVKFLEELLTCRKCFGFWAALLTGAFLNVNFFGDVTNYLVYGGTFQNEIVFVLNWVIFGFTQIVTAIFTTYGLYYLSVGISAEHQVVIVGSD